MSKYNESKVKAIFGGKGFYIALVLCLLAAAVIVYVALLHPLQKAKPVVDADPAPVAPVIQTQPIEDIPAEPVEPTVKPEELVPQVISPLDGTTVTVFSTTELMYDETMADWRTHNGLDIQAAEGDSVKTAADGTVLSVKNDELMGTTVVIRHADGYTTQYSSLMETPPVSEGQQVRAGDIIGCVGSTAAAENSMGAHLHFSVAKDGKTIDPTEYVK
ncbi:MAG: M23 family metallopeptidase [Eubacteriales bacterium]|nr:M23 family metallopeptidase [Eubacteriales bacterium]